MAGRVTSGYSNGNISDRQPKKPACAFRTGSIVRAFWGSLDLMVRFECFELKIADIQGSFRNIRPVF